MGCPRFQVPWSRNVGSAANNCTPAIKRRACVNVRWMWCRTVPCRKASSRDPRRWLVAMELVARCIYFTGLFNRGRRVGSRFRLPWLVEASRRVVHVTCLAPSQCASPNFEGRISRSSMVINLQNDNCYHWLDTQLTLQPLFISERPLNWRQLPDCALLVTSHGHACLAVSSQARGST
jgi:hypothetical protein